MTRATLVCDDGGQCRIAGELSFDTVNALWASVGARFKSGAMLVLDLAGTTHCDSAGLAFLIECVRTAHANLVTLEFRSPPAQLLALASASHVADIIF
ncbi:MAG: STAS domain-containing protein [Gammaproteobacteria bacterium]|nr:STAS domain-containing protein [Gammaproteobacteria bacterium]